MVRVLLCSIILYKMVSCANAFTDLLVSGCGCSLSSICCIATISQAISGKRQALYLSICMAATGLNQIFYPFVFDEWMRQYGLNGTWLLTGGLLLNVWTLPTLLYMNQDTRKNETVEENVHASCDNKSRVEDKTLVRIGIFNVMKEKYSDTDAPEHTISSLPASTSLQGIVNKKPTHEKSVSKQCCINIPLIGLIIGTGITVGSSNAFFALLLDIFRWKGYGVDQSLKVFIPISIFNILSRIVTGLIKQRQGINSFVFPMLTICIAMVGQTLMIYLDDFIVISIGAILIAILHGTVVSTAVVLVVKLSKGGSTVATGILFTVIGITSSAFSPLFGKTYLNDLVCYLFCCCCCLF